MGNYVVSARKYRPANFADVIGQSHITDTLQNAINSDHLAHSFLFCGPRGVGKTTCARILAKTINCENLTEKAEPCNSCSSCESFNNSNSFNIHELDAASNNKVDDMRMLIDQVRIPPPSGKYKIYIIDEVHMLSASAFNAFLKTLEEPPAHTIFILATTEKHKIIPTILSRCQIFDFKRVSVPLLKENMHAICEKENVTAEEDAIHVIAQKADGSVRDSLSILDRLISFSGSNLSYEDVLQNLNVLDYDYFFKVTDHLLLEDIPSSLLIFDEILDKGFDCDDFNMGLSEHFRNLMVCKDQKTKILLEASEQLKQRYVDQSKAASLSFLLNGLKFMNECDVQNRMSVNRRLTVELTLMKMAAVRHLSEYNPPQQASNEPIISPKAKSGNVSTLEKKIEVDKAVREVEEEKKPSVSAKVNLKPEPIKVENSTPEISNTIIKERTAEAEGKETIETPIDNQSPKEEFVLAKTPKIGKLDEVYLNVDQKIEEKKEFIAKKQQQQIADLSKVSQENLLKSWKEYSEVLQKEKRISLQNLVESFKPKIVDNKIQVIVESSIQQELLNNEEQKLADFMSESLGLPPVQFAFIVDNSILDKQNKVPYTSKDKYDKIVEKNPAVKDLKDSLGLELEF